MLDRLGRWALGLYEPSAPPDLRLTETPLTSQGLTPIISKVPIPDVRRSELQRLQQRAHDRGNQLVIEMGALEEAEIELERQP
jgi:hypothetical protein